MESEVLAGGQATMEGHAAPAWDPLSLQVHERVTKSGCEQEAQGKQQQPQITLVNVFALQGAK